MASDKDWVPDTPEGVAGLMNGLSFDFDREVPGENLPPAPGEDADALVPRSVKLPLRLDVRLQDLADARGIPKSALIREYLEAAVAAEADDGEVLIPLADALRLLAGLGGRPHRAA
jgi:predicted DNA-binding protein